MFVLPTLRINGISFRPKVFAEGLYTVKVGEGKNRKSFKGITASQKEETLKVAL